MHDQEDSFFHFTCQCTVKIDLVVVVYYLKQVFHLLYDKSVTLAEALLFLSIINSHIIRYDVII